MAPRQVRPTAELIALKFLQPQISNTLNNISNSL
jgi:hypothetical protein